jgi:hypothetical protein
MFNKEQAWQIVHSAECHYNRDTNKNMFAVDVKLHSFVIPDDIDPLSLSEVMEDYALMEGIWDSARSWFEEVNPDYTLLWFGRSNGWIGFEKDIPDDDCSDDELTKLTVAIASLEQVRTLMFNSLWEEARAI